MIFFETRACIYPNCFEDSVKSHAISRSISLESISEEHHLYSFSPRQNSKETKVPLLQKISTNKATRHFCFCDTHEKLFDDLDDKEIEMAKDIHLQVYRTLCVSYSEEKEAMLNMLMLNNPDSYKLIGLDVVVKYLVSDKKESVIPKIKDPLVLEIVQKHIQHLIAEEIDKRFTSTELSIERFRVLGDTCPDASIINNKMYTLCAESIDYNIYYYKTDFQIPVALSTSQPCCVGEQEFKVHLMVIPYVDSTVIIGVVPDIIRQDKRQVDKINDYFTSKYKVIKYVESVMSTSDGWFLKPSVIDGMSKEKLDFFTTDCMFINERKLFQQYDLSIFDELKIKVCGMDRNDLELTSIPVREEYSSRYDKMLEVMKIKRDKQHEIKCVSFTD
ncbi:hypothetical protein GBN26_09445 [Plesiomonas shigelloides]|uniref:hypothetical protein n=1 Tax=Plesiomonas shigelloides TaxID=703 RepID=UPI00126278D8|nr:hypothetical protein [Plesiomonas shigelloides]KAB7700289.1 hypothetical protein GBN26_09445 [Plesiomonas shigelloides]